MKKDFFENYNNKIKTKEELAKIIGAFPRKNKVILCHGVFDVVHPGHLRHLAYAKSKASILIVSITVDKHIQKGIYRPHIPQGLRSLNLAALEMVDYVLVDQNATPIKNLKFLKPDFFAKGFEYSSKTVSEATKEEAVTVNKYGGKLIYTPGDIVYSSSKFLNLSLPKVQLEKLLLLMKQNNISFPYLRDVLKKFSKLKINVIGDTIVDSFTRTNVIGGQIKTPTISVLFQNKENYIGGAAIVSQHIKAAGAKVKLLTVLGNDELKKEVLNRLKSKNIDCEAIIDNNRPTTNKDVILAGGYRLLKIDKLDNRPISMEILNKITSSIKKTKSNAIILSDFRHGIFNQMSIPEIIKSLPKKIFKAADSQVATRWGNITEFKNFDLITPNEREARFALADQDSTVGSLSTLLQNEVKFKNLIMKLGDRGVFCSTSDVKTKTSHFSVDSFAKNVIDPVGAGDALLAYSTLSMLVTKSLVASSIIGSMAAACKCEKDGNFPVSYEEVLVKIDDLEKSSNYKSS